MASNSRSSRFSIASSIVKSTPLRAFNLEILRFTYFSSLLSLPTQRRPLATFPMFKSEISFRALFDAKSAISIAMPFSKRFDASLLRPSFLEVSLTLVESKLAASSKIFLVSLVTSVSNPPITPARPTAFSPSAITSIDESSSLSSPSMVFRISPSFASLTISSLP